MRGRWVLGSPLLIALALAVAASPLIATLVLAGALLVGLGITVGRRVRRRSTGERPGPGTG
jgi:hypothetical protein